eukprot:c18075_g1_i1.p1 GENE.c18075_g1_i1~~c18075_g1_i1.p1  ORF type:complete len:128 (+),score=26.26 c18075_g1_i1:48-386(+)
MNEPNRFELFIVPDGKQKVEYKPDTMLPNAGTFVIEREDHTIGNLLRSQLLKSPSVLFSGYIVPHPLQHKIEIKLQTVPETSPKAELEAAIRKLRQDIESIRSTFAEANDKN